MYSPYEKGIKVSKTHHILVVLLALGVILLAAAGPASAALIHPYLSQITGTPAGPFNLQETRNSKVAVDPASQDVYIADFVEDEQGFVDIFNSSGVYQSQITNTNVMGGEFYPTAVAVSDKTGDVYVASVDRYNYVYVFNALGGYVTTITGTPTESFTRNVPDVAVDQSSGDLYVVNEGASAVYRFNAANEYQSKLTLPGGGRPTGVATDSSGDVYVAEESGVYEFNSSETQILHLTGTPSGPFTRVGANVAVDAEGNIYVGSGGVVDEFDSSGNFVDETSGTQETSDTLNGPPGGRFNAVIGVAVNAAGDLYVLGGPAVDVFGPSITVPDVSTEAAAAGVSHTAEVLHGTVDPDGTEVTSCVFEYRTAAEPAYGQHSVACSSSPGNGNAPVPVSAEVSSLAPSTTYYYRVVTSNAKGAKGGANYGSELSFHAIGPPKIDSFSAQVPSGKAGQTHTTLQAQIDPEGGETIYHFEYGENESYGTSIPVPAAAIGPGEAPVSVTAELSGLKVGTTYHYRVSASNEFNPTPVVSADQTFTTVVALTIGDESASGVASTSATLDAQINPLGSDTTAYVQYGTANCATSPTSCVDSPLPPGADLGSAEGELPMSVHVQGLTPDTTYHYRFLATDALVANPPGVIEGPDETFTTQAAATAVTRPDGRVWELVSPPNKQGAGFFGDGAGRGADIQAAADGAAITYAANAPIVPDPAGSKAIENEQVFSTRHAPGSWGTADITTAHDEGPTEVGTFSEYRLFSSDLSLGAVEPPGDTPLPPLPAGSEKTVYLREADGEYKALVTSENVQEGVQFGGNGEEPAVSFVSASRDFKHVVLKSTVALVKGAPSGGEVRKGGALYEWAGRRLRLVSVLPGNKEAVEATLGNAGSGSAGDVRGAISDDGSRIVWEATNNNEGRYYLRDMVKEETIEIDSGAQKEEFDLANSEGSRIFLTNAGALHVVEVTSGEDEPLAVKATELSGDVKGVIGASEDGSYVYFVAGDSIFVDRYDETTEMWMPPTLIAALSAGDAPTWGWLSTGYEEHGQLADMTSRVSPNGRYLAFMSEASLTGYDNRDANSGVPDEEVFVYHAPEDPEQESGGLICASCDPTGARPVGVAEESEEQPLWDEDDLWEHRWVAGSVPGWTVLNGGAARYQSRYLSNEGRLFFDSADALVPADVDGQMDVYEYEPAGVGGCRAPGYGQSTSVVHSEGEGGCVGLISSGTSSQESAFLDASETGGDVFFLTTSRLSPLDYDTSYDVYDAHECSAEAPCAPPAPPAPAACTTSDACKAAPTPQPTFFGAPSSETFSGAGNVVPEATAPPKKIAKRKTAKCAKGKKLSHGRCVRRRPVKHARKSDRTTGGGK
jgi:hypothetical protein